MVSESAFSLFLISDDTNQESSVFPLRIKVMNSQHNIKNHLRNFLRVCTKTKKITLSTCECSLPTQAFFRLRYIHRSQCLDSYPFQRF